MRIEYRISSTVNIGATPEEIWPRITNVRIEEFSDPLLFRFLGIPKPLTAELLSEGVGGMRHAHFGNGKKFSQKTTTWNPFTEYAFTFHPDPSFRVGFIFDLNSGFFQIHSGSYLVQDSNPGSSLRLETGYSLGKISHLWLGGVIRFILNKFQKYLLESIKIALEEEKKMNRNLFN